MSSRERLLSLVLLGLIFVVGGSIIGYLFILSPMWEKEKQITKIQDEIFDAELDIQRIINEKRKFEQFRVQSLPADVKISRGQYAALLEGLIRRADYPPGFKVSVLDADTRSAPTISPKKPAYVKLGYEVTLKGDLYYLVDFLRHFYEQPLLHTIKKINIQKSTESRARNRNDLDVAISIEAIVLDVAEDRPILLPAYREVSLLAGAPANVGLMNNSVMSGKGSPIVPKDAVVQDRNHLSIAGKNIFFGPPPKVQVVEDEKPAERDVAPFVTFVACVGEDGIIKATLRDKLNNQEYVCTQYPDGKIVVESLYTLNERQRPFRPRGIEIVTGSEEGKNMKRWIVRRVGPSEMILESVDLSASAKPKAPPVGLLWGGSAAHLMPNEGKMYRLSIGQSLDKATSLLTREAWVEIFKPTLLFATEKVEPEADRGR